MLFCLLKKASLIMHWEQEVRGGLAEHQVPGFYTV